MGMNTKSLIAHASPVSKCWTACLLISACLPAAGSAEVLYTFTDLGTLGGASSVALGINGQVVGSSSLAGLGQEWENGSHAFLYDSTGMHDFGFGTSYGEQRAFLLTPIPEPATLALILIGGICAARRFRRA